LDRAIAAVSQTHSVNVRMLPFFLRPNFPEEGVPRKHITADGGISPFLQKLNALEPKINFDGACKTAPNTIKYHMALAYVFEHHGGKAQARCSARIFEAHLGKEGVFPDDANLLKLCLEIVPELDTTAFAAYLVSDAKRQAVLAHASQVRTDYQVSGVPFFVINDKVAVSGAQQPEALIQAFMKASA